MPTLRSLNRQITLRRAGTIVRGRETNIPAAYANPYAQRRRGYIVAPALGIASQSPTTFYTMRAGPDVRTGDKLVDGGQTLTVTGISDVAGRLGQPFIEVTAE